jgi:hypothetical protein
MHLGFASTLSRGFILVDPPVPAGMFRKGRSRKL